ncbi:MAG: cupin [Patescibacteria group bacterium]
MEIQKKLKPWGEEIWFAHTEKYAGKILRVKKGHRLSLQYHEQKMETQYLFKGSIKVSYGATAEGLEEKILQPGEKIDISPKTIHRIEALEDSEIFEVSTPELDDIVKLADDYGRTGKGNDEKKDEILSGQKNM